MALSSKACNFDTAINEINCKLLGISPHSPPVVPPKTCNRNRIITTENKPAKTHRPPHCITCQHAKARPWTFYFQVRCLQMPHVPLTDLQ